MAQLFAFSAFRRQEMTGDGIENDAVQVGEHFLMLKRFNAFIAAEHL